MASSNPPEHAGHSSPSPPTGGALSKGSSSAAPKEVTAAAPPHEESSATPPPRDKGKDVLVSIDDIVPARDEGVQITSGTIGGSSSMLSSPSERKDQYGDVAQLAETSAERKSPTKVVDIPATLNVLPNFYKKMMECTVISAMQLMGLILLVSVLISSLSLKILEKRKFAGLSIWRWELQILVLILGRLMGKMFISFILLVIEKKKIGQNRISYYIYRMRNPITNCVWSLLVMVTWIFIFSKSDRENQITRILSYLSRIWVCLIVGTFVWLVKSVVVMILVSSFHVSVFFDRVKETLIIQNAIETLSLVKGTTLEPDVSLDVLDQLTQKSISSWNMKQLIRLVRKKLFSTRVRADFSISSEHDVKSFAEEVFLNVAKPEAEYIFLEDLLQFMPEEGAKRILHQFEKNGANLEKGISERAFKRWVITAFQERKALALSLDDTKTAVKTLQKVLSIVVGNLILIVSLLILKVATRNFLVFVGSQIILAAFMFGNTCKTVFEAIIFLFVMHPFDVGDRVEIDGIQFIVDRMNLLTTTLLKSDNLKVCFPNSVLATRPIYNFNRSPHMEENVDFCVHVSTHEEKIEAFKKKITRYVENNDDHWQPSPRIMLRDVDDLNKLKMTINLVHRMNFQDMNERWERKSLFVQELIRAFREFDIEYRLLPLDVNLRNVNMMSRVPSNWSTCN